MAEYDELAQRYLDNWGTTASERETRYARADVREALVERTVAALQDAAAAPELAENLRTLVGEVKRRADRAPGDPDVALELGAMSTLYSVVRLASGAEVSEGAREVARDRNKMALLTLLDQLGPLSKGAIAERLYPSLKETSARPMVTRLTQELESSGWLHETQAGKERIVELTGGSRRLLSDVEGGRIRAAAPEVETTREDVALDRIELKDTAARPTADFTESDRTRFHLYVAGLYAAEELIKRSPWRDGDVYFARLLRRYPLSATDDSLDEQSLQVVSELWPRSDLRRELIECLFRFQMPERRKALADDLARLGTRLEPGSSLALLWAPCALNVATRLSGGPSPKMGRRLREQLLERADELLRPSAEPIALHWRGVIAKLTGHVDESHALWQKIADAHIVEPRGADSLVTRRITLNRQLQAAARFNLALDRDFDLGTLSRYVRSWVTREHRVTESFYKAGGGEEKAAEIAGWSVEKRAELAELLRERVIGEQPPRLLESARGLVQAAEDATRDERVVTPDFRDLAMRHRAQAAWLLGLDYGADVRDEHDPIPRQYQDFLVNDYWSPEVLWVELSRSGKPPTE